MFSIFTEQNCPQGTERATIYSVNAALQLPFFSFLSPGARINTHTTIATTQHRVPRLITYPPLPLPLPLPTSLSIVGTRCGIKAGSRYFVFFLFFAGDTIYCQAGGRDIFCLACLTAQLTIAQ